MDQDKIEQDRRFFHRIVEEHYESMEILDVEDLTIDSARGNAKRLGYIKIAVPDDLVKNLRGRPDMRDRYFFVIVPRDVVSRAESRIILPSDLVR